MTVACRLLFDESNGAVPFSKTPDSEKDTHSLKARYDMSNDTVISAGCSGAPR